MISQYFTRRILLFCSLHSNDKNDMSGRKDARDIHDCDCVSLHRGGNHAFRDFSSLRTHFRSSSLHPPFIREYGACQEQSFLSDFLTVYKKLRQQLMALENKFIAMFPFNRS